MKTFRKVFIAFITIGLTSSCGCFESNSVENHIHLFGKTYLVEDKLDLSSGFMIVNELVDSSSRILISKVSEIYYDSLNVCVISDISESRKKHILVSFEKGELVENPLTLD
tara:strand:+ start:717 stop:1049 length:333 start_codon:yes stop_codon:yes gene_type:complete